MITIKSLKMVDILSSFIGGLLVIFFMWVVALPSNYAGYYIVVWLKLNLMPIFVGIILGIFFFLVAYNSLPSILQFLGIPRFCLAVGWEATAEEGANKYIEIITVQQKMSRINGKIFCKERDQLKKYKFKGIFRDRFLTALYESTKSTEYERGAFVLECTNDGNRLQGGYIRVTPKETTSTSPLVNSPVIYKYNWRRLDKRNLDSKLQEFSNN